MECESGISIKEVLDVIVPKGWFLPVVPGTSYVTIGGAIANDIHGKNHHNHGSFGNFIEYMEVLKSNGDYLICSIDENPELFKSSIGGLGLTGIILKAKIKLIKIENNFINTISVQFSSLEEFFNLNLKFENQYDYTVSWIDFDLKKLGNIRGVYHAGNHDKNINNSKKVKSRKLKKDIRIKIPFTLPFSLVNNFTIKILNNLYYNIFSKRSSYNQNYKKFFFPLDTIENWSKAYGPKGFYQYQFLIPSKNAHEVINSISALLKKYNQKPALGVLKSFGNIESLGYISFPKKGITLALDLQNKGEITLKLLNDLDKLILDYEGRLYPAKDCRMSKDTFKTGYKNIEDFKKNIDPKFNSSFFERILSN